VSAFHTVQTLGLMRSADAALTELSAAWVVNGKGVAQQALAERALLARDSRDPATASLARALTGVRADLAALSSGQFKPEEAANRQARIAALNKQEEEASRKLGQAAGRPTRDDPWIELNEVRQALAPDAVLVEISRFNVMDFKEYQWRLPHYAAWIVPPAGKGAVRLVDLGEAGPIDDAVNGVLRALREALQRIPKEGEAESERALQGPLQGLAKLVLEPLMPHIADAKRWVIGPDAQLWLVPWAALPLKNGSYAIEQYSIGYVVSGRDLVTGATKGITDRPLILADPDFDLSPSAVTSESREALRGAAVAPVAALAGRRLRGTIGKWNVSFAFGDEGRLTIHDENAGGRVAGEGRWALEGAKLSMQTAFAHYSGVVQSDVVVGERTASGKTDNWQFRLPAGAVATRGLAAELRSSSLGGLLGKVPRLPGTAVEAEAISPSVKAYAKAEPRVYTDKQALEGVFKVARSPRLVVLSTHGFFLPKQQVKRDERFDRGFGQEVGGSKVALGADGKALENPLLRCGLLLAGCNQRDKTGSADGDDGVLTGLEIVGTDLRGTELVVLSACETALGEVRDGEGVAGLRQAFQLAGAQSVVATLWQIPDRDSALLMTDFFGQLASGHGKVEALREAQLARIKARRARNEAAHPFFWAAFTFTGQDGHAR
jgi:CHAT domain-containing protein